MTDKRVSMFVSHKVDNHQRAACRIKAILESRTERLDVYICEETPAGDRWREWVKDHISHSQILLVLLPHTAADLAWIELEIKMFKRACRAGRLVILKPPSDPVPAIVQDRQVIDASKDQLVKHFLDPLYRDPKFVRLDAPLNRRITDADLQRDAEEIEQALLGMVDMRSVFFGESLLSGRLNLMSHPLRVWAAHLYRLRMDVAGSLTGIGVPSFGMSYGHVQLKIKAKGRSG